MLGHVVALQSCPVKGFGIDRPSAVEVSATGVAGDRDLFVMDADEKLFSAMQTGVFLPYRATWDATEERLTFSRDGRVEISETVVRRDPVRAHFWGERWCAGWTVGGPFDAWLSEVAGQPLRLVRAADPSGAVDVEPVTLVTTASVAAVGVTEADGDRRFRLNLTIEATDPAPYQEDAWAGRVVRVGEAAVRIGGPVPRCAAVQRDPGGSGPDRPVLKEIFQRRGRGASGTLDLGVYAEVVTPGRVAVGDPVVADD